jgi:predicted kinase
MCAGRAWLVTARAVRQRTGTRGRGGPAKAGLPGGSAGRLPAVPRLIHLNGPPGIGKSVLAQLWAEDHPGALNLDIDRLRALIGGWRERFAETGEIVRPLALGMAGTHLRGGRDVVMPQYLGRLSEIDRFEAAAHDAGAAFCEIVLMDTKEHALERFSRRGDDGDDEAAWHHYVQERVERGGGQALLARMYDQLTAVLAARPMATVIPSTAGAIGQAYQALTAALSTVP